MKAIFYHSLSKRKRSKKIAETFDGDLYEIVPMKKPITFVPLQMFVYGFMSVNKKPIPIKTMDIPFDKYDEVVLVSPVYAGKVNPFMRQFLKMYRFHDKKVTIVASCDGGYKNYFKSIEPLIDNCCTVVDRQVYVKGEKVEN